MTAICWSDCSYSRNSCCCCCCSAALSGSSNCCCCLGGRWRRCWNLLAARTGIGASRDRAAKEDDATFSNSCYMTTLGLPRSHSRGLFRLFSFSVYPLPLGTDRGLTDLRPAEGKNGWGEKEEVEGERRKQTRRKREWRRLSSSAFFSPSPFLIEGGGRMERLMFRPRAPLIGEGLSGWRKFFSVGHYLGEK